jgi:hypothetical protein
MKVPQRIMEVSSSFSRTRSNPNNPTNSNFNSFRNSSSGQLFSSSAYNSTKGRLRFQKKGQVQSIPNRKYFSRSLQDKEDVLSGEEGDDENDDGALEVFSTEQNTNTNNSLNIPTNTNERKSDNKDGQQNKELSAIALPLRTDSQINLISRNGSPTYFKSLSSWVVMLPLMFPVYGMVFKEIS